MPFTLYADEQMTREAISPYQLDFNGTGKNEFRLYFGSPYSYETLRPKSDEQIMLIPASRLKKWEPNSGYSFGNIVEPIVSNGYMYESISNGRTSSNEPVWPTVVNDWCSSGGVHFLCLGAKFQLENIRMSLTQNGLDKATPGAFLPLGEQLQGGKPITVFIRVTNDDSTPRSDRSDPCISIRLNATTTETIAHSGNL